MARLKEYNGHYCESEYEYAFIGFLEAEGWKYSSGNNIHRVTKRDILIVDDFKKFIADTNPDLTEEEVTQIYDNVRLVGAESDFATLHKVYGWMVNGVQFTPQDGLPRMIPLIDFDNLDKNIFRVVNQFTVEYTNNGQKENRRPDVLLFVNGMPLCVIELKNPADANATIYDAWEQINIRYWRDIPHLLHYCPLACISDGVKTRLGTVRTPYEHFYAWRRVNDGDAVSTLPFEETETMIKGVYAPERFLEIFRDYIYFQDSIYDSDEVEIVCRYPQFFAARLLKQSIINSVVQKSGKGGTYFGATGCGKTYGLYGVNNINRYMQKINPSKPIEWGNWTYKVGDKVLFNENRRFGNVLYNNLKGRILSIDKKTNEIVFQVLVDKVIDKRDALFSGIKLIDCECEGKSIVKFGVKKRIERDSDADYSEEIVPFQIAYAVSIHKAQGLEYESVKVVITEDVDERISHNIFYTAITRTTDRLKIYMSKETQNKLAEKFVKSNVGLQQAQLFAGHAGLKLKNKLSS